MFSSQLVTIVWLYENKRLVKTRIKNLILKNYTNVGSAKTDLRQDDKVLLKKIFEMDRFSVGR